MIINLKNVIGGKMLSCKGNETFQEVLLEENIQHQGCNSNLFHIRPYHTPLGIIFP